MKSLAAMYENGWGVTKDAAESARWSRKAAAAAPTARDSAGRPAGASNIGSEVSPPRLIHKVAPEYSKEARKAKFQGTVVLYVLVDEKGDPRDVKVVRGLGLGLDQKAIEAVQQWRFEPGLKNGKPVPVGSQIEISFRLTRDQ